MTLLAPPTGRRATLDWPAWVRTTARPGPERWLWWAAGASWVVLLLYAALPDIDALTGGTSASDPHSQMATGSSASLDVLTMIVLWVAMVTATMLPLVAWNVRFVALRSPPARRTRATRDVVAGWGLAWAAGSVLLLAGTWEAQRTIGSLGTVLLACALAVVWQFTPTRRRALARCHLTFAPPLGARARPACRRFGRTLGRDCFLTCWPLMAVMGAAGHELVVLLLLAWLSWRDRRLPADQPVRTMSTLVLVLAGAVGMLAL